MDYDLDFERYVARLVDQEHPEAVNARVLQSVYPDIQIFVDPDKSYRYYTKTVNRDIQDVFIMITDDGAVVAMPYADHAGCAVHSDPPMVSIGVQVQAGFGVDPVRNWRDVVEKLPKLVRDQISDYLDRNPPIFW